VTSSPQVTESGETSTVPTAMVSWAHANTDWDQNQTARWEQAVKEFAQLLRTCGVDVDLDLWHLSETSVDWTRWVGPGRLRVTPNWAEAHRLHP
jgi:hypothetical protein